MTVKDYAALQQYERDNVVISGISGSFPEAENVQEFANKLLLGENLLNDSTTGIGKLKYINKFDAEFFGVKNGNALDPASRIVLEKTYEAIVDSGTNISLLKGKNCGVFITLNIHQRSESDTIPSSETLISNKISQWLGIHGPSVTITSCPSTLQLLELAYESIWGGKCESAIVGACNFYQDEPSDLELLRSEIVNPEKTTKPFDDYANGAIKSETVGVLYLQRASEAKRIYTEIVNVASNFSGNEPEKAEAELLQSIYKTAGVDVNDIEWIEASGSAIKMYDEQEINVLAEVFKDKQSSILIGSVKSNVGNAESASDIASIIKVIVAMEYDIVPATINVTRQRNDIEAVKSGLVKVITEKLPWNGGLVGVNSFNPGGNNYHCLLKSVTKSRQAVVKSSIFPYVVGVSGRTSEAVGAFLSTLETEPLDLDYVHLLHELYKQKIPKHPYRAFFMASQESKSPVTFVEKVNSEDKSLWYLFPDSNSIGYELAYKIFELDCVKDTIYKCHEALKYKGLDLIKILKSSSDTDSLNQYIRNAVLQLVLVDFLSCLNIKPDGYIGYSMGEITCAYLDGHITVEEAILLAYYLAYFIFRTTKVSRERIGTAVVGVQYDEVKTKIPISLKCHPHQNIYFSVISGPLEILETFVERHNYKCATKTYEDRYVPVNSHVIFEFSDILNQVIRFDKPRTKKWVSASISEDNTICSAEYFSKILLATSDQIQPFSFIPRNAVILVIGSDHIAETLQIPTNVEFYPLLQKNKPVEVESLLTNIGRAYVNGVEVDFGTLYARLEGPVGKATKMISPVVRWNHDVDYNIPSTLVAGQRNERIVRVSLNNNKMKFIAGHGIDVAVFYPGMGYIVLVWETLALIHSKLYTELPVVFENVRFSRATVIPRNGAEVVFHIAIQKVSGYFELTENDQLVASGYVYTQKGVQNITYNSIATDAGDEDDVLLDTDDLYKEYYLRGYNYRGIFQSLIEANMSGKSGRIRWADNWVPFLDCMLQTQLLQITSGALIVPTSMEKLVIDVDKHKSVIREKNSEIPVYSNLALRITEAGGVQMKDTGYKPIPRRPFSKQPVLLKYNFVPFISQDNISQNLIATVFAEILMEHVQNKSVNIAEVVQHTEQTNTLLPSLLAVIKNLPIFDTDYTIQIDETEFISPIDYSDDVSIAKPYYDKRFHLIALSEIVDKTEVLQTALKYLLPNGFLALKQNVDDLVNVPNEFSICCDYVSNGYRILLLHRETEKKSSLSAVIKISSQSYSWIPSLQNVLKSTEKTKLFLLSENETDCGVLGFYNCFRMERGAENVRCVSVVDATAPQFSLQDNFYKSQLSKNLAINIYKHGKWGRYVRVPINALSKVEVSKAIVGAHKVGNKFKLDWFQGFINNNNRSNEKLIYSYYSSLNTTDVLLLTGRIAIESIVSSPLDKDYVLGREFSGYGEDGKRYMGICNNGALSTVIKSVNELLVEVPTDWSLEDAATVPFAYFIVLYALTVSSEITEGDSILIHSGATVLSQAAINIATFYKCVIFVTVANATEKSIVITNFPDVPEDHIVISNDDTFEQLILAKTNNKGVRFVLNSLNDDKISANVNSLNVNGHFIQTKKIDVNKGHAISSAIFTKNISFHSAVFEDVIELPVEKKLQVKASFEKHLSLGAVKPLIRISFVANDLDSALKHAVVTKNTKKILIKTRPSDSFDSKIVSDAVPRFLCSDSKSYVICGGLGGIGLQLINWLIVRGARKILVTSRTGVTNGYQKMQIAKWKSYGAQIVVSKANVSNLEETRSLLDEANVLGPVAAIFNLAAVLRDKVFKNQTEEFFKISAEGKAIGTQNLDKCSRAQCSHLEYFVVFSSISCGYGNIGQTNYGMSNSTAERICEKRKQDNLPALAVQWGAVGDVGMAMTLLGDKTDINIGGTLLQPIASCLESLEQFLLRREDTIVTSFIMADKKTKKK